MNFKHKKKNITLQQERIIATKNLGVLVEEFEQKKIDMECFKSRFNAIFLSFQSVDGKIIKNNESFF